MQPLHSTGKRVDAEEIKQWLVQIKEYSSGHGCHRGSPYSSIRNQCGRRHGGQTEDAVSFGCFQKPLTSAIG
jgi:hypothetical protein